MTLKNPLKAFSVYDIPATLYLIVLLAAFTFVASPSVGNILYSKALIILSTVYFITVFLTKTSLSNYSQKFLTIFVIVISFLVLLHPPDQRNDIKMYMTGPIVETTQDKNPYIFPLSDLVDHDKFPQYQNYYWWQHTYPYSPLFLSIGKFLYLIAGENFNLNFFLYRLFFSLTFVASYFLSQKVFNNKSFLFLYFTNPVVISESLVRGHIESPIILSLIIFYGLLKNKKYFFSWTAALIPALLKINHLIYVPFIFIHLIKLQKQRLKFTLKLIISGIVVFLFFYLPYMKDPGFFEKYSAYIFLSQKILISVSPILLPAFYILNGFGILGPNKFRSVFLTSASALKIVFVLYYFLEVLKFAVKKRKVQLLNTLGNVYTASVLFFNDYFLPYYFVPSIFFSLHNYSKNPRAKLPFSIYAFTYISAFYYFIMS